MERSVAWSRKGSRAVVVVPKTRAKTTTILGATSPFGVVNIKIKRPKAPIPSKKRKTTGSTKLLKIPKAVLSLDITLISLQVRLIS